MAASVAFPVTALTPVILFAFDPPADEPAEPLVADAVFDKLTDVVVHRDIAMHGSDIDLGDGAVFRNEITGAGGEPVAELTGAVTIVHRRPSDGRLFGYYREDIRFADGTARTVGIVDLTATMAAEKQSVPVYGTGGRYRGATGSRTYQATGIPETFSATIVLRPRAARPR